MSATGITCVQVVHKVFCNVSITIYVFNSYICRQMENREGKYRASISNEEVNDLSLTAFDGEIIIVDGPDQSQAAAYLSSLDVIGFDTESRVVFVKGVRSTISLVQLSGPDRAYLFRVNLCPLSSEIVEVLQSRTIVKVGLAIGDDINRMQTVNRTLCPQNFVDLQSLVGHFGIEEMGLKKICAIVLGLRISKAQRLSNWNAVNLTEAQRIYAATDAWICLMIYRRLMADRKDIPVAVVNASVAAGKKNVKERTRRRYRHRRKKTSDTDKQSTVLPEKYSVKSGE